MFTRLSTWTNAKDIDGGIDFLKTTALPAFRQQRGYLGLSASVDRSTGTLSVLSTWETEADRDASESAMGKTHDQASEVIGGTGRVEKLEQLVGEVVKPPVAGSALMVTPFSMDPSKLDENLAFFKEEVLPKIKSAPGFCAVRNMVDRSTGKGYVGTVWADEAAMKEQAEAAASRREGTAARGITFGEISYREMVVVDNP